MLDIANNFAGTLMGIINALGRITLADLLKNIITFHFLLMIMMCMNIVTDISLLCPFQATQWASLHLR